MTDIETAWAAGLWEGEGCFSCSTQSSGRVQPQAIIASTDEDVILKFQRIIGFGKVSIKIPSGKNLGNKTQYVWRIQNRSDFKNLVLTFWPYLGERRKARAMEILDLIDSVSDQRVRY